MKLQPTNVINTSNSKSIYNNGKKINFINSSDFALMIIIGGILGLIIIYRAIPIGLGFLIGSFLFALAIISINRASSSTNRSRNFKFMVFLGCMGLSVVGGIYLYLLARRNKLTF